MMVDEFPTRNIKGFLLFLILIFHTINSFAECPYTFSCTQQGCVKVTDSRCTLPTPLTPPQSTSSELNKQNSQGAVFVSPNTKQNSSNNSSTSPSYGGCAENGSCYGDISSVNGTPKTIQVDGYYRRDGTYVRGHYRSSGR